MTLTFLLTAPATTEYCAVMAKLCLGASEWASWVQALGSILAIVFAIAIASWQHFAAKQETRALNLVVGEVVADAVFIQLGGDLGRLKAAVDSWKDDATHFGRLTETKRELALAKAIVRPTDEQLISMAKAWPEGARFMAMARSAINTLTSSLEHYVIMEARGRSTTSAEITSLLEQADLIRSRFKAATQEIRPQLLVGGPTEAVESWLYEAPDDKSA
ncbi:MAG: hypothetical protein V4614_18695 [Pseudomonadota bacterium]